MQSLSIARDKVITNANGAKRINAAYSSGWNIIRAWIVANLTLSFYNSIMCERKISV